MNPFFQRSLPFKDLRFSLLGTALKLKGAFRLYLQNAGIPVKKE